LITLSFTCISAYDRVEYVKMHELKIYCS